MTARGDIAAIAHGAATEFDVMTRAVAHFGGGEPRVTRTPNPNPNLAGARADVGETLVLAAPYRDPERRPNTRDNYDVYAERIERRDSVLVVTSSIYLPYQFFVALQALGWNEPRTIEAVGFPPRVDAGGAHLREQRPPRDAQRALRGDEHAQAPGRAISVAGARGRVWHAAPRARATRDSARPPSIEHIAGVSR